MGEGKAVVGPHEKDLQNTVDAIRGWEAKICHCKPT